MNYSRLYQAEQAEPSPPGQIQAGPASMESRVSRATKPGNVMIQVLIMAVCSQHRQNIGRTAGQARIRTSPIQPRSGPANHVTVRVWIVAVHGQAGRQHMRGSSRAHPKPARQIPSQPQPPSQWQPGRARAQAPKPTQYRAQCRGASTRITVGVSARPESEQF